MAPKRTAGQQATAKGAAKKPKLDAIAASKMEAAATRAANQTLSEHPHFKGFTHTQKYGMKIDNKSLHDTIYDQKLKHLQGGPCMKFGLTQYKRLASAFAGKSDPASLLVPDVAGLPLSEELVTALCSWGATRDKGDMVAYMTLKTEDLAGPKTHKQTSRQAGKQASSQTGKQADKQAGRPASIPAGRQASRQAHRQASQQPGRQAGKQACKQAGKQQAHSSQAGRPGGKHTCRHTGRQASMQPALCP